MTKEPTQIATLKNIKPPYYPYKEDQILLKVVDLLIEVSENIIVLDKKLDRIWEK